MLSLNYHVMQISPILCYHLLNFHFLKISPILCYHLLNYHILQFSPILWYHLLNFHVLQISPILYYQLLNFHFVANFAHFMLPLAKNIPAYSFHPQYVTNEVFTDGFVPL